MNAIDQWASAHGYNLPQGRDWSPAEIANLQAAGMPVNVGKTMNAIDAWASAHGYNLPGAGDYWSPQEIANLVAAGMPQQTADPISAWASAHGFNLPAAGDYWGPDEIQNLIQAGMPASIANSSGQYDAGMLRLNETNRAQAQQAADNGNRGGGLTGLALGALAAYFGLPGILGNALGIGSVGGGALSGALTSTLTGGNPLTGALSGGIGGSFGGDSLTAANGGIDQGALGQILNNGYASNAAWGSGVPGILDAPSPVSGAAGGVLDSVAPVDAGGWGADFWATPEYSPTWIEPPAPQPDLTYTMQAPDLGASAFNVTEAPGGWGSNTIPGVMGNSGTPALETGSTGGNMGFFDSILGSDPWGAGVADPALSVGELNVPNYTANVLDQVAPGTASATGNSAWDTALNGGAGVLSGGGGGEYLYNLLNGNASIAPGAANALKAALGLGGGGAAGASKGSNILGQITGNPLGSAFNALPFGLALMQANSQKNDIAPYIQNLNNLASQYGGNQQSYLNALTDPYDQSTGVNRQRLMESLNQRGVAGSSFGDQAINNFDYTAGLGRADLLGKGIAQGAQTGAGINTQAINAINARNLSSNALIGAGLNASGQLFNPVQNDQFNLKNLFGVAV